MLKEIEEVGSWCRERVCGKNQETEWESNGKGQIHEFLT